MAVNSMKVNVRETLTFFDEKPPWSIRQATAIVGVLGEDLSAAVMRHCLLEAKGASNVCVRSEPVSTGGRSGPHLDRWIEADLSDEEPVLFQTEIKSWSAHAIGGKTLQLEALPDEVEKYRRRQWENLWDAERRTLGRADVAKVLVHMKPPPDTEGRKVLPLLIFWTAMNPGDQPDVKKRVPGGHLFSISEPTCDFRFTVPPTWPEPDKRGFPELWVFSVSSYLRSLKDEVAEIELEMPNAASRMRSLNRLVQLAEE